MLGDYITGNSNSQNKLFQIKPIQGNGYHNPETKKMW